MNAYFISGLGADSRVFCEISLPPGFKMIHIGWCNPEKNESLGEYAMKMAEKIDINKPFVLIGLSMGGMIASEIAQKYKPAATILISSVACSSQLPIHFKIAYLLRLHRIIPAPVIKSASVLKRLFTVEEPHHKSIMRNVVKDSDPRFIKWAMNAILQWKNDNIPSPLWHIHGTRDEILPFKKIRATHTIQNGKHMMVLSRAEELNKCLNEILSGLK